MTDFQGRLALITGSGTGVGRALATKLAAGGADLILNYSRSATEAEEAADLCRDSGAQVQVVQADVSDPADCQRLADAATAHGRLDILVNNAGITRHAHDHSDLDALSKEDFMDVYAVNVVGPFLMLQAAKPLLLAAHEQSGRVTPVLNTSSIAGIKGTGSSVAYACSKGALNTMTISMARALAPQIRVNAVCPGLIDTRWFRGAMDEQTYAASYQRIKAGNALQQVSDADDIADAALFLVSDASRHVTGETLLVDAGMHLNKRP